MGFGVTPDYVIKAVRPDAAAKGAKVEDDPLPRILELLGTQAKTKTAA